MSVAARAGLCARGVVYLIIGAFIAGAAFRPEQPAHGVIGALQALADPPIGKAALLLIAAGLACLAAWLAVAAIRRRVKGSSAKLWLVRLGMLGDAAVYATFLVLTLGLVLGWRGDGDATAQKAAAWLFGHHAGRALVGLLGAAMTAGGLGFIGWAWIGEIERPLALPERLKQLTEPISRFGLTGRGAAIALIGGYLLAAAIDADPSETHGLGGVLSELQHTGYGAAALIVFALAFGGAGFFDFLQALYRRVSRDDP